MKQASPSRPALTNRSWEDEVRLLIREREPFYRQAAHFMVDTDEQNLEDTVVLLLRLFTEHAHV